MDFWKNEEIVHFCADKLTFYGHNLRRGWGIGVQSKDKMD
jgi:hypothetical protein